MRVVFVEDVYGVALGGDVKNVKNGFARNYLIPQGLALPATKDALRRIDRLSKRADETRIRTISDMKKLSDELDNIRIDVEMRAGATGRLYGSVTNAIIADQLSEMTNQEIDRRKIDLPEPIRELGSSEVRVRLHPEVETSVSVLIHPLESDPDEFLKTWLQEKEARDLEQQEQEVVESGEDIVGTEMTSEALPVEDSKSNEPSKTDKESAENN